jgi:hypothetical protein
MGVGDIVVGAAAKGRCSHGGRRERSATACVAKNTMAFPPRIGDAYFR